MQHELNCDPTPTRLATTGFNGSAAPHDGASACRSKKETSMKKLILSLAIVGIAAGTASAQQDTDFASASASATIVQAISITKTADLQFGKIVATNAGTVTIEPDGDRTFTGVTFGNSALVATAAEFTVTGEANATYSIALPADGVVILSNGTETMAVDGFVSNPAAGVNGLLTLGTQDISVGATLTVASGQMVGVYTDTFDVTVSYN